MKIVSVTAKPLAGAVRPDRAIASSLGPHLVGAYVLVTVATDSGVNGLGEATVTAVWSGETQTGAISLAENVIAPLIIGADPFDLAWIDRRINAAVHGNTFIKSAIESALLDAQGRAVGQPVCRLLGGRNPDLDSIRLKFVIGAVAPALAAERASAMAQAGWTAIKVKVGVSRNPPDDLERLTAVREAIGPNVWLSIDANGAFSISEAVWLSRRLERLDVKLFEQPTRRGQHLEMAAVRRKTDIPVMADESVFTLDDAVAALSCQAADVISVYPGKSGGLRPTQDIVRLAEAHGVACTIGSNLEREIATAAMTHLVVATPNLRCERYPGDLIGPLYFESPATRQPLEYRVDRLIPPLGPGLGVEVIS